MPLNEDAYIFESQQEFDRMARTVRWAEGQMGGAGNHNIPPPPIQPGAGEIIIRVTGTVPFSSDVFATTTDSSTTTPRPTTSTTTTPGATTTTPAGGWSSTTTTPQKKFGAYKGRFCTRNTKAKKEEDVWEDGDRCLVVGLNSEKLQYGCRYKGFVTDHTPDDLYPVVVVTVIDPGSPCAKATCSCQYAVNGAPPEFEFYADDFAISGISNQDEYGNVVGGWVEEFQFLRGDWALKSAFPFGGDPCEWRNASYPQWKLNLTSTGATLTGIGAVRQAQIVFTCTGFDPTVGGDFTFSEIIGVFGPGTYVGTSTISVRPSGPVTGCPTTTPGKCLGDCFWNYTQSNLSWALTSNTCATGCRCFAPVWCPPAAMGDICTHTECGRIVDHEPAPNCVTTTTTTAGATTTPSATDYFCFMYTSQTSCGNIGDTFCGTIPPYTFGGGVGTCGGGVFFNYSMVSGPHANSGACATACAGATTSTTTPGATTTANPCGPTTPTVDPSCEGSSLTYICVPGIGWVYQGGSCCPGWIVSGTLPGCSSDCISASLQCLSPPPPPPPSCTGMCQWVGGGNPTQWVKVNTTCAGSGVPNCYCDSPSSSPGCGQTVETACYVHTVGGGTTSSCNNYSTTTTTPSGVCGGNCIYRENGAGAWVAMTVCPGCLCDPPIGTPSDVCDRQIQHCRYPSTTTTPNNYICYYCQNYSLGGSPFGVLYPHCTNGVPGLSIPPGGYANCSQVSTHSTSNCDNSCTTTTPSPTTTSGQFWCFQWDAGTSLACGVPGTTFCHQADAFYTPPSGTVHCGSGIFGSYTAINGPHASSVDCNAACSAVTTSGCTVTHCSKQCDGPSGTWVDISPFCNTGCRCPDPSYLICANDWRHGMIVSMQFCEPGTTTTTTSGTTTTPGDCGFCSCFCRTGSPSNTWACSSNCVGGCGCDPSYQGLPCGSYGSVISYPCTPPTIEAP